MIWMKRGLCGLDLKKHTYLVAAFDMLFALLGIGFGFILLSNPETFVYISQVTNETHVETIKIDNLSQQDAVPTAYMSSDEGHLYHERLLAFQNEGLEIILSSVVTVATTLLLINGCMKNKSTYFIPWLVENVVGIITAFSMVSVKVLAGTSNALAISILFITLFCPVYSFLIYGVASHYVLLKRMKRHSREIINSVMQGNFGYMDDNVTYQPMKDNFSKEMQVLSKVGSTMQPEIDVPPMTKDTREKQDFRATDDVLYFSI